MTQEDKEKNVNHPSHYTDGKIEVIEFIEDKGLGFCLGNAIKYISRAGKKDPNKEIEDLEKAIWYIKRRIKQIEDSRPVIGESKEIADQIDAACCGIKILTQPVKPQVIIVDDDAMPKEQEQEQEYGDDDLFTGYACGKDYNKSNKANKSQKHNRIEDIKNVARDCFGMQLTEEEAREFDKQIKALEEALGLTD